MNDPVVQLCQLGIVPAVGCPHQVAGDALQLVDMLAAALRAFFQVWGGVFVAALQTAVTVVVYRTVADVVSVHHVHYTHNDFRIVGGVTVYLHIEDVSAAGQFMIRSLHFRNTNRATTLQHGSEGQQTVTTRERWVDGELENSVVTDVTTTVEPTDHVVKTYGAGAPVSPLTGPDGTTNAPASYSKVLTGKATGYYSKSGKGSSGLGLGYGTVAVDPDVIPYGTLLYITSTDGSFVYGYAVATDTGIAVQDGRILVDLFYETYAESVINGAINVNVYVVG